MVSTDRRSPRRRRRHVEEWYRRTGADLPGADPRPSHGAEMEGYLWRVTDAASGRVVVALCGVNRGPDGDWATVAVGTHPGACVVSTAAPGAVARHDRYEVLVPGVLHADEEHLRVTLDGTTVDLTLDETRPWPLRTGGGGVFSVVPFLGQYWHPHVLGGSGRGTVTVDGQVTTFDGARVYAEKNWGRGFPELWWWGEA